MSAAWAMVRHRFASFAGTFVAVFLGVAVVAGATTLYLSSQPQAPARYDHAPVLISPPDPSTGHDQDRRAWTVQEADGLAARLGAVPGVTAAVPDPWFYVQRVEAGRPAGDPQAALVDGHAWSSAALGGYRLISGRAPSAPGEVVLGDTPSGTVTTAQTAVGKAGGDEPEGETAVDEAPAGDKAAGGNAAGRKAAGEAPPSEKAAGEAATGEMAVGEAAPSEPTVGEAEPREAAVGQAATGKTAASEPVVGGTGTGDTATSEKATRETPAGATAVGDTTVGGRVAAGATIEVLTSAGPEKWTVTGTVDGPGFYVTDGEARRRASGVHVIGLTVTGDAERAADGARTVAGGEGVVRSGAERDSLEPQSVTRIRWIGAQLLIALVMLSAFATVFVVASTCALSAAQRRRELGLLRAVGATPGQVRRLMYAEATLIALLAGLIGAPAGAAAAPLLAEPMIRLGLEPAGFTVTPQPWALAGTVLLGLVVALAGVTAAARRASRIAPLDALREATVDPRPMTPVRWAGGVLSAVMGGALLAGMSSLPLESQVTAGLGAAMLLLTAATLLAPVLIGPMVRAAAGPWRNTATGMLVREGTLAGVRRVASTAAPVLATVGLTVLLAGMVATIEEAAGFDETAKYPDATVLVPDGTPGLSAAAVAAQGAEPALATRVLITHGDVTTGQSATGSSDGLVLDRLTADSLQVGAGDTVTVRFVDGAVAELAVTRIGDETGLPRELVREHDPDALTSMIVLEDRAVPAIGARALPVHDFVMEEVDEEGRLVDLFLLVLIGLTAGYTAIAVGNTLLMATAARRTEFRALRLAGAGTGQVLRVVSAEALLAVGVGALLGGLVAGIALVGVRAAVENEIGREIALVVPWGTTALVIGVCLALAMLSTAVPVLRRAR